MQVLSTLALVDAWEDGMGEPLPDRAPALLRSLGLVEPACDPAVMTVGACDLLLFDLRRWLFGPDLDMVATCPDCGEEVELAIPIAEVVPAHPGDPVSTVTFEEYGLRIRCRVPTNGDLSEVAGLGPKATIADLLERCVEAMEGPGAPAVAAALPPAVAERVAGGLAGSDPGAEVTADIECPCGAVWPETVDIRSILWTELTRWVQGRLDEVHQLALAYGWAERDILEMSLYRRRFYLESCAR
ncbi:MAG: hypothetical protein ACLQDY_11755 [Streptosporangiaceae bacterium]|jgi:hypothetical protein